MFAFFTPKVELDESKSRLENLLDYKNKKKDEIKSILALFKPDDFAQVRKDILDLYKTNREEALKKASDLSTLASLPIIISIHQELKQKIDEEISQVYFGLLTIELKPGTIESFLGNFYVGDIEQTFKRYLDSFKHPEEITKEKTQILIEEMATEVTKGIEETINKPVENENKIRSLLKTGIFLINALNCFSIMNHRQNAGEIENLKDMGFMFAAARRQKIIKPYLLMTHSITEDFIWDDKQSKQLIEEANFWIESLMQYVYSRLSTEEYKKVGVIDRDDEDLKEHCAITKLEITEKFYQVLSQHYARWAHIEPFFKMKKTSAENSQASVIPSEMTATSNNNNVAPSKMTTAASEDNNSVQIPKNGLFKKVEMLDEQHQSTVILRVPRKLKADKPSVKKESKSNEHNDKSKKIRKNKNKKDEDKKDVISSPAAIKDIKNKRVKEICAANIQLLRIKTSAEIVAFFTQHKNLLPEAKLDKFKEYVHLYQFPPDISDMLQFVLQKVKELHSKYENLCKNPLDIKRYQGSNHAEVVNQLLEMQSMKNLHFLLVGLFKCRRDLQDNLSGNLLPFLEQDVLIPTFDKLCELRVEYNQKTRLTAIQYNQTAEAYELIMTFPPEQKQNAKKIFEANKRVYEDNSTRAEIASVDSISQTLLMEEHSSVEIKIGVMKSFFSKTYLPLYINDEVREVILDAAQKYICDLYIKPGKTAIAKVTGWGATHIKDAKDYYDALKTCSDARHQLFSLIELCNILQREKENNKKQESTRLLPGVINVLMTVFNYLSNLPRKELQMQGRFMTSYTWEQLLLAPQTQETDMPAFYQEGFSARPV